MADFLQHRFVQTGNGYRDLSNDRLFISYVAIIIVKLRNLQCFSNSCINYVNDL